MTAARQPGPPAAPAAPRPVETAEEARALCAAVERSAALLAELIDQETDFIARGRAHEIEGLQGDKAELAAAHLAHMTRLRNQAEAVRALASDEIAALRPKLQELGAKLLRNQDALKAILAVCERLIRSAALRAIAADSGPASYGGDARIDGPAVVNPATAIDRRL